MNLIWNPQIQPINKAELEKHLTPFLWLVPQWCISLNINLWDSTQENCGELASVVVSYDYRRITIDFTTTWLDRTDREKTFAVVHELVHGFIAIMADFSRDTINNLCPESEAEKFNKFMQSELRTRHESATEDLAFAIMNKLNAN